MCPIHNDSFGKTKNMKPLFSIVFLLISLTNANNAFAQKTLEDYLVSSGLQKLRRAAHPSNDFLSRTYNITPGYIDISIKSWDNVFDRTVRTDMRVVRGGGGLYFSNIVVQYDDDIVRPFDALEIIIAGVREVARSVDPEAYNKVRQAVSFLFSTNFENWNGKMWTIALLNLDYYNYLLGE